MHLDDKRVPSRITVPARATRGDLDVYVNGNGGKIGSVNGNANSHGGGPGDQPTLNILAAIWRRRGWVVAFIVLALIVGFVYLMKAEKVYSSTSTVLVQTQTASIYTNDLGATANSTGYLFTECQLITSTPILQRAVEVPGVSEVKTLQGLDNPAGFLRAYVTATPSKMGDIINISFESRRPDDAATIVNGIVTAYTAYQAEQHVNTTAEVVKLVQAQIREHNKELKEAQDQMIALRRNNPTLGVGDKNGQIIAQRLSTLNAELSAAKLKAGDYRAAVKEIDAIDPHDINGLREVVDQYQLTNQMPPSTLQPLLAERAQLNMQLQSYLVDGFGEANEFVRRTRAQLQLVDAQLAETVQQESAACLKTVHSASAIADRRAADLDQSFKKEQDASTGLNVKEAEYDHIAQSAARAEQEIAALTDQAMKLVTIKDAPPTTITVLEQGKPSFLPVKPKPSSVLGLAGVGGLLAGMAAGLLFDRMDQRLRTVDEVVTLLDATVLGVVPRIVRRIMPGEAGREIALKPRSGVAEAFRTVRTAIYFGGVERAGKTILVTSPTPGDGKSTCISNLAIAVAQGGRRTLLIDADCRRPVQHKTYELPDGPGLSSVLTGTATLDEAIQPSGIERLDILPCGPLPHNPAELLDSQALLDLLAETGRRYDQVLIDSPPVTLVSDARVLAASCDAAFLVVRSEKSTRRGVQLAWNALSSVGANLLGVVVNDMARQKEGYGYSYYGYGRYGAYSPKGELPVNGNGTPAVASVD